MLLFFGLSKIIKSCRQLKKKKKKEFGESLDVCFLIQDISLASPSHMWKTLLLCTFETAAILVESSKALETEFEELHVGHQTRFIGIHPLSVFPIYSMYVCTLVITVLLNIVHSSSLAQCKSAKLILVTIIYYYYWTFSIAALMYQIFYKMFFWTKSLPMCKMIFQGRFPFVTLLICVNVPLTMTMS